MNKGYQHSCRIKRLATLPLAFILTLSVFSQSFIVGTVQDAFLKIPLPEAKVSLLLAADSTVVIDSIPVRKKHRDDGTVREAQFSFNPERKTCDYLIKAELDGYEDGYMPLSIDGDNDLGWMMKPLELRRMRQVNLGEVTVRATKIKMFYRGDTIVYDATAFQMPEGSMLDDLIRQMPGVTMNEGGEIFVNGRKIDELQLASRSFMRGNSKVLLENLPYYTVKDIKVYEQDTDLNRAIGAQVEKKKYVMDVNLKQEYQRGYIANVEAAGGTEERWLGRAFLLGFTSRTRYTLFANSNNVNESRHIGSADHWTPGDVPNSLLTTHSGAAEIDYESSDKSVAENLNVDFTSTRNEGEMMKRSELFLPGNPLQATRETSLAKAKQLQVGNRFKYIKPKKFMFDSDATLTYRSYSGNTFMLSEQFVDSLTTRQRTDGFNDGKVWTAKLYARAQPTLGKVGKWDQYSWFVPNVEYISDENQSAQRFKTENFVAPSFTESHNSTDYFHRKIAVWLSMNYSIEKGLNDIGIEIIPLYCREKTRDWLYHPDTLLLPSQVDMLQAITDRANSYNSELQSYWSDITLHLRRQQTLPETDRQIGGRVDFLVLDLTLIPTHERLRYQRGALDTLATRTTVRFEPHLYLNFYVKRDISRPLTFRFKHYENNSPLVDQIDYRDDATPLVVRLGNPDLKSRTSVSFMEATYEDNRNSRRRYNLFAHYGYIHSQPLQSVSFNPSTGVYTYRPQNIHGIYDIKARANFFCTLDEDRCWTVENRLDGNFVHWLDHVMLEGETESRLNAVNTLNLHDGAYIQYNKGALNVRATGDIRWRHSESETNGIGTLNATDFQYGLSARYTIPGLNTTISADGNMYSRRGYGSSKLNTDDFVLNASISQPLFKGKLIARIEAFDILHQLSSTQYVVNAQGRTETWYRSLPHYVMAHLVYHFNKNPKRK